MFKTKFIISLSIFLVFLVITSTVKNKTRVIEKKISNLNSKILIIQRNFNEAQLDFHYLSSPAEIEKKINVIGLKEYQPIKHSNIFLNITDFTKMFNKITNLKIHDEKKIKKK